MNVGNLCATSTGGGNGVFPVSAFSAFHLLRNYNYLLSPQPTEQRIALTRLMSENSSQKEQTSHKELSSPSSHLIENENFLNLPQNTVLPHNLLTFHPSPPRLQTDALVNRNTPLLSHCGTFLSQNYRRQRGEKKPIPDEQKDDKYFERRRRNNQAAKKSRDARKLREDQVALRATLLEHENAILKAQVLTLREEASSLRQMLLQKKSIDLNGTQVSTICN